MSFKIILQQSKKRAFTCEPQETILSAALRAGVELAYGCKNGACGACKGQVLEGRINQLPHQAKALSPHEETQGFALFCCATPASDLLIEASEVTGAHGLTIKKMPVRVKQLERLNVDVMLVALQLPHHERLQYLPGQYVDILLKDGGRKSYSIANACHLQDEITLHIRHMPGGVFTDHLFAQAKVRDIWRIEAPLGSFFLHEDSDKPILFIASGTGFAPIKAILEHLFAQAIRRPVTLYWGGRRPKDIYLSTLCEEWQRTQAHFKFIPVISNALAEDKWPGRTGFVHHALMQDFADLSTYQVYACGTPLMVESAKRDLVAQCHLPASEFYADAFISAADLVNPI